MIKNKINNYLFSHISGALCSVGNTCKLPNYPLVHRRTSSKRILFCPCIISQKKKMDLAEIHTIGEMFKQLLYFYNQHKRNAVNNKSRTVNQSENGRNWITPLERSCDTLNTMIQCTPHLVFQQWLKEMNV